MAIGRTDEWRQSSEGQRHINAVELFGCHSRNPSGLAVMRPRQKAGHMTAFVPPPNSCNVALESMGVPHMTRDCASPVNDRFPDGALFPGDLIGSRGDEVLVDPIICFLCACSTANR